MNLSPILQKHNWDSPSNLPSNKILLPMDLSDECYSDPDEAAINTGLWTAINPLVWKKIEPVLRLVTRFLTEIHTSIWV